MILPPWPRSLNAFVAAWMPHTTPLKLIEKILSMLSGVMSSMGDCGAMPALLMMTSKPPSAEAASATAANTLSRSATFTGKAIAPPSLPPRFSATAPAVSMFRSAIATLKPSACSRSAIARPMP